MKQSESSLGLSTVGPPDDHWHHREGDAIWWRVVRTAMAAVIATGLFADMSAAATQAKPNVVLLFQATARDKAPLFNGKTVQEFALENFHNPGIHADTVVLGGHSSPPTYVGHSPWAVAQAIASFQPSVVVLETCYGASTPIMNALVKEGVHAWVVAAPYQLPVRDLVYEAPFFSAQDPEARVMAVHTLPPYPLLRWSLNAADLQRIDTQVAAMKPAELKQRLKRIRPNLVRVPLPTRLSPKGTMLVPVPTARFK